MSAADNSAHDSQPVGTDHPQPPVEQTEVGPDHPAPPGHPEGEQAGPTSHRAPEGKADINGHLERGQKGSNRNGT